jgi:hydrogenase expression/formation protein HypC
MCLAVPGKVVQVTGGDAPFALALVEFGGVRRTVNIACTPDALEGDYVMVHAGIAISRVNAEAAARILEALRELGLDDPESDAARSGGPGEAAR